jgi:uncharacterized protein (TIGR03437 family)
LVLFASIAAVAADARLAKMVYSLPLSFESHGTTYISRGAGYALSVSPDGAVLALRGGTVRMRMVGSNAAARMEARDLLSGHATYFLGNSAGETFQMYGQVLDRSVYPGIDLVFHGNQDRLEYDFRVAAGSSARRIALAFEGGGRAEIDARGDLVLHASAVEIRQSKPVAYQMVAGRKRDVAVSYRLDNAGHARFHLGPHDSKRDLVIDPTLVFDNQFGASGSAATAVALDTQGNVYVTGQNPFSPIAGTSGDVFINKWNAAGDQLIYSANLGGNGTDRVSGLAVDASGNAYVVGWTSSLNFPVTANAFQKSLNGTDNAFVAKVSPDGTRLVYASLLGGGSEQTGGIAVDSSGAAYVTGATLTNFPTTANAFQKTPGVNCTAKFSYFNYPTTGDAFVAKISPDGGSLVYASYLGGGCGEYGFGIAANADGTAWVVGSTFSPNFPVTADALQPVFGGGFGDGFLVRVSAAGDRLAYSTFLGGNDYDQINAITRDISGNLYLTGSSAGFSQPASPGAFQPLATTPCIQFSFGPPVFSVDGNAFVMKLNPTAAAVTGLTYIGSPCSSSGGAIGVDTAGAPWIAGFGYGSFPMATPLELQAGTGFISKFSSDLTQILFATSFDTVNGLAVGADGMAYVAGTAGQGYSASTQAYLAKIDPALVPISLDNVLSASPFPSPTQAEMLAPGKVIRVVGRGIGPSVRTPGLISGGAIITSVAGVTVMFDSTPAPLLYVSSTEIGCIVPYALTGHATTTLQVTYNGVASNPVSISVSTAGMTPEVLGVYNSDFSPNSASNPAQAGSIVTLYVTGGGQTLPASFDGEVYGPPLPQLSQTIAIQAEGGPLTVTFAAAAYGLADGIFQVNYQAPTNALNSPDELTLSTGIGSTNFWIFVQ